MTTRNLQRALIAADEYRYLLLHGRYPEAQQTSETIDALVGFWEWDDTRQRYIWQWPRSVRHAATR